MQVEFLVEEPSAEAALNNLVPRILGTEVSFTIHVHQGKTDLLRKLPGRLKGYHRWMGGEMRLVVLIDKDRDDCKKLKAKLEKAAVGQAFSTPSSRRKDGSFQLVNRIAVEELEAWFFGDVPAIVKAYPKVPDSLDQQARYRVPDAIKGGTSESLEKVLRRAGYYVRMPKIEVARNISAHMDPARNTSQSFQLFRDSIKALVAKREEAK